jgi:Transaldolase/Fructose-6-phosphate aldolase
MAIANAGCAAGVLAPLRWLDQGDRGFTALRRATRPTIIMPTKFALGDKVIGNPQSALFAAFGPFAMPLLVDFGGPMAERLQAQAALAVAGGVFVCLATLTSQTAWLAPVASHMQLLASQRWQTLAATGARPQRVLWASTSTKNPDLPDTYYLGRLAAASTIDTVPEKSLLAFADRGNLDDRLEADYAAQFCSLTMRPRRADAALPGPSDRQNQPGALHQRGRVRPGRVLVSGMRADRVFADGQEPDAPPYGDRAGQIELPLFG